VLEIAGDAPYDELLRRYVCEPAGMTGTLHADGRAVVEGRARAYVPGLNGFENARLQDLSFLIGAGAVLSTPRDIFRLQRRILDSTLGSAAQIANGKEEGFRWNGVTNGYRAFADHYPESDITIIVASNLQVGSVDRLREDLPRVIAGEEVALPVVPEYTPVKVDDTVLARYEGTYQDQRGSRITLSAADGMIYANDWLMIPTSATTFFSPQDYHAVTVVFADDGAVERLDWEWQDGLWPWTRLTSDPQ
jgi:hypothetical protein